MHQQPSVFNTVRPRKWTENDDMNQQLNNFSHPPVNLLHHQAMSSSYGSSNDHVKRPMNACEYNGDVDLEVADLAAMESALQS